MPDPQVGDWSGRLDKFQKEGETGTGDHQGPAQPGGGGRGQRMEILEEEKELGRI